MPGYFPTQTNTEYSIHDQAVCAIRLVVADQSSNAFKKLPLIPAFRT